MMKALPEPNVTVSVFDYGFGPDGRSIEVFVKAKGFIPIQNDRSSP
jgi:hypothetical protein